MLSWSGCIRSGKSIDENDLKVRVLINYKWADSGSVPGIVSGESVVTAERTLKLGLLGNETVAGVSLRLVALVLPGLLFLMVLRVGKGLVRAGHYSQRHAQRALFRRAAGRRHAALPGSARPIEHCQAPLAFGRRNDHRPALRPGTIGVRRDPHEQRAASAGHPHRGAGGRPERLLVAKGTPPQPTESELKTGKQFVGSLAGKSRSGDHVLLGWFVIDAGSDDGLRSRLNALLAGGQYRELFEEMRRLDRRVKDADFVQELEGDTLQATQEMQKFFADADVQQVLPSRGTALLKLPPWRSSDRRPCKPCGWHRQIDCITAYAVIKPPFGACAGQAV